MSKEIEINKDGYVEPAATPIEGEKKKPRKHSSEILEKVMKEIPLETKIKVAMQLEYMGILTDLGLRENKSWGDDENELLSKLYKLAGKQTERIMEILNEASPTPAEEKPDNDFEQDFKELNIYLDYLCSAGHDVKDAGHTWIAFTDKFNAFRKRVLVATAPQQEAAQGKEVEYPTLEETKKMAKDLNLDLESLWYMKTFIELKQSITNL